MSLAKAVLSAAAGEVKLPSASAILGELGTLLVAVISTLSDTHGLVLPASVMVTLNVIAGVLVTAHVAGAKALDAVLANVEKDLHITAAQTKAAADSAAAAKQATDLASGLDSMLSGLHKAAE